MNLTPEHVAILDHTHRRAAQGLYCGDSPAMQQLVNGGLMAEAGRKSFVPDPYFRITGKGRLALRVALLREEQARAEAQQPQGQADAGGTLPTRQPL